MHGKYLSSSELLPEQPNLQNKNIFVWKVNCAIVLGRLKISSGGQDFHEAEPLHAPLLYP